MARALAGAAGPAGNGLDDAVLGVLLDGLCQTPTAEVVAAALDDGVADAEACPVEHGEVGAGELALERDREGGQRDLGLVVPGPECRRHEVGERLARARSRLEHRDAALVQGAGDLERHGELAGPGLVAGHEAGEGRLEEGLDLGHVDGLRVAAVGLDHPVVAGAGVVDDDHAHAVVTIAAGQGHVGAARLEAAGRVVVDDDLARPRPLEQGGHGVGRAPAVDAQVGDLALGVGVADGEDLDPAGISDGVPQDGSGGGGEAHHRLLSRRDQGWTGVPGRGASRPALRVVGSRRECASGGPTGRARTSSRCSRRPCGGC